MKQFILYGNGNDPIVYLNENEVRDIFESVSLNAVISKTKEEYDRFKALETKLKSIVKEG
jgi:hypothetical protein